MKREANMDSADIMTLANAIAEAVAAALSGLTIEVDGEALGRAAARAINLTRAGEGKPDLEL